MMSERLVPIIAQYANIVGRHGPDSDEAREFRDCHLSDEEFRDYADALDRIKRHLGGSGIDWEPRL
jgi:hypothetical protein